MSGSGKSGLLGSAVRMAREAEGISMRGLARRSGLDPGQVSRIESGRVEQPEYRTVSALARALGRPSLALELLVRRDFDSAQALLGSVSDPELEALRERTGKWQADEWEALGETLDALGSGDGSIPGPVLSFAWDLFVHITSTDQLEQMSQSVFADDLREVEQLLSGWRALTDDRRAQAVAYVAEQVVLSELDRRGSNTQRVRVRVELITGEAGG